MPGLALASDRPAAASRTWIQDHTFGRSRPVREPEAFETLRPLPLAIACRMLASVSDAEDVPDSRAALAIRGYDPLQSCRFAHSRNRVGEIENSRKLRSMSAL